MIIKLKKEQNYVLPGPENQETEKLTATKWSVHSGVYSVVQGRVNCTEPRTSQLYTAKDESTVQSSAKIPLQEAARAVSLEA